MKWYLTPSSLKEETDRRRQAAAVCLHGQSFKMSKWDQSGTAGVNKWDQVRLPNGLMLYLFALLLKQSFPAVVLPGLRALRTELPSHCCLSPITKLPLSLTPAALCVRCVFCLAGADGDTDANPYGCTTIGSGAPGCACHRCGWRCRWLERTAW